MTKDANGFIHGPWSVTMDSNGTKKKKNYKSMKAPPASCFHHGKALVPSNPFPSHKDLDKLETAIFENETFRKTFLQYIVVIESASAQPSKTPRFKGMALRHCWNVLKWRPSRNGMKVVVKHPNNPYIISP